MLVELAATLVSVHAGEPQLYLDSLHPGRLPAGSLLEQDLTLERGVRRILEALVAQPVGYIEQLYTFGDLQRWRNGEPQARSLSVAYLGLVRQLPLKQTVSFYELFPWEDRRKAWGVPILEMLAELRAWCRDEENCWRYRILFGQEGSPWNPERVLERYELLFEARLVEESNPDCRSSGLALWSDHRRIAATALSRLRGKLAYRPLVFELLAPQFTLTQLQETVEALSGGLLHKQNFRRMVETAGLVEMTGESRSEGRGRPARLYQFRSDVTAERPAPGISASPFHH